MQKKKAGAVIGDVVLEGEVEEVTLSGTGHPGSGEECSRQREQTVQRLHPPPW